MKIITWNCQMAFRKKHPAILAFQPDILVVPECENEERLQFGKLTPPPTDFLWIGDNPHKGIGIFSYSEYRFQLHEAYSPAFRYIVPIKVTGRHSFLLLAVWAMPNKENRQQRYIGQVWSALQYYRDLIKQETIVIGDFNGNQIWDKGNRYTGNFMETIQFLETHKIKSLYHIQTKEAFGQESTPTFFLYKKAEKPYHLDYCMATEPLFAKGFSLTIGDFDTWMQWSDHLPIIVDLHKIP